MRKKSAAVRYPARQIKGKIARGQDRTDWAKVKRTTGSRLEASILADADDVRGELDWTQSVMGLPSRKDHINIRPRSVGMVQEARPRLSDADE
jgi:hypothetical protein